MTSPTARPSWQRLPGSVSYRQREGWLRAALVGLALGVAFLTYARLVARPVTLWLVAEFHWSARVTVEGALQFGWMSYIFMVILGLAAGGFWEELFFRGLVLERIAAAVRSPTWRWPLAIVASTTVDALAHLPFWGMPNTVYSFLVLLLLGITYVAIGRDIRPLMVGHAFVDVATVTRVFLRMQTG